MGNLGEEEEKKQQESSSNNDDITAPPIITLRINGIWAEDVSDRIMRVVMAIKKRAIAAMEADPDKVFVVYSGEGPRTKSYREIVAKKKISIESFNNFATAAGLASSASGLSCLARCLAAVYNLDEQYVGEFSMFARLGSGSACRSVYGGVVEWERGFTDEEELK